jgi:hypothetical protein
MSACHRVLEGSVDYVSIYRVQCTPKDTLAGWREGVNILEDARHSSDYIESSLMHRHIHISTSECSVVQ